MNKRNRKPILAMCDKVRYSPSTHVDAPSRTRQREENEQKDWWGKEP